MEIKALPILEFKSDKAIREILLGWLELAASDEITLLEIHGIVNGDPEPRISSFATTPRK